jgi:hypothetical protein
VIPDLLAVFVGNRKTAYLADFALALDLDRTCGAGKLLIDKGAPAELKDLVRAHKQELIDVRRVLRMDSMPLVINDEGLGSPAIAGRKLGCGEI